jgi:amino acid adenylation domain-containing protein
VAGGYWGKPEESERTFGARLPDGSGPYLRTGDLGFLLDGELYVTGRLKDLIIVRGRNLYPQDVERTLEASHPALRAGCGAAFAVEAGGEERLVVVQEVERHGVRAVGDIEAIAEAVRRAVAEEHEVQVHDLVLLRTGTVPKTSSGKIQRHACRAGYLAGELEEIGRSTLGGTAPEAGGDDAMPVLDREALRSLPAGARQEALLADLRARAARLLRVPAAALDPEQPLTGQGLDSLTAVELQSGVESELGLAVPVSSLLEGATLRDLAGNALAGLEGPGGDSAAEEVSPIPAGPAAGDHPLSPGQKALWFLERLAPEAAAYNIAAAARVSGDLDVAALRHALVRLVERHPSLRTTFPALQGEPVQRVAPAALAAEGFELVEEQAPEDEAELAARLAGEAHRPFDLAAGPLLRVRALRRSEGGHALLVVVHHLVADFWSLAQIAGDLGRLYSAERAGEAAAVLATVPLRYTDWVRWQEARLAGPVGERLRAFWLRQLCGHLPALDLPADRPRPPVQTYRGAEQTLIAGPALAAGLEALGRRRDRRGATLYMTLAAAFQALLGRYTGQEDVLIGSPAAGRGRPELREVVGYFAGPLVLRGDLSGDPPFEALLDRVRRAALDAFAHAEYPFERIVEALQPERDPSRSPVFQVLFTFQSAPPFAPPALASFALGLPGAALELGDQVGDLTLEPLPVERRAAPFDLSLQAAVIERGGEGELALALQYNTDLFEAATAGRLLGHLTSLLAGIVERPETPLSALPLLPEAERRQILEEWNATAAEIPAEALLHRLFEAQARRVPGNPAVSCEGRSWTYAELDARAERLAGCLRRLGVGPDVPVGLCAERSPEMVAGLLGVLKAGGAYVPLDPSYPRERLTWMLEDAWRDVASPVLLTQESLRQAAAGMAAAAAKEVQILALDEPGVLDGEPVEGTDSAGLAAPLPESLAYVIYTSGSTGRPKGVQIPHRAVVNFLLSMAGRPGLGEGDTLLAVTTLSFDIAGLEIYLPLSVGARIELASREVAGDGLRLARLLAECGASVMQATPATWRLLLESGWAGREGLRIFCGGEGLPRDLADRLLRAGAAVWNLYGPTETTIWSAAGPVGAGEGAVPVGGPIANTRIHVLDPHLAPVPAGIPGEVYIGGDGLARGYLHRPELTAERFVPDPFGGDWGGRRLYRVGDLGRWRTGGALEILGRVDHQVKVRGFRIELGEIEAALAAHPEVRECVAVVREDQPGDRRLAAYVAGAAGIDPAVLRSSLAERLPDYMVPSHVVILEALPRTPNGKVDRRALPAPVPKSPRTGAPVAPRTALERTIAAVWAEVLGVERVGVEDNFFDLGGHSLLVARVHGRLRESLGRDDLTMVDLFRHPTVVALARYLAPAEVVPAVRRTGGTREAAGTGERPRFAIVGMACRFPGAPDLDAFWRLLREGREAVTFFSPDELRAAGVSAETLADPSYVPARAVLAEAESFDAPFFGFTPREAEVMEPQHRVFLETAWEALEHAGYDSGRYPGRIGVFAGVGINTYLLQARRELLEAAGTYQAFLGNDKDFVPTRVSYKLDLRGPSINVQTACSSSLVALHLACQSLALGESDMALAGGVTIRVPQTEGYLYQAGGILSPDGHCRAFDERAAGTVFGNGAGVVLVKRLEDALADGDRVWAVVRGTAINNDGAGKIGYTAPSVEGQAEVIRDALRAAGVGPETVTYVETHGTGTELGDLIEVAALRQAFGETGERRGFCALGSVKTNVGHLDTAAGMAGLIKTVLALHHREIPPTLHFERPRPALGLDGSPFRVASALAPWESADGAPRRAGVSSFGIGGTNVHAVLEEAPAEPARGEGAERPFQLLVLSARTPAALEAATGRLAEHLRRDPAPDLADVAFTLQTGRRAFEHRRILVARDAAEALEILAGSAPERLLSGVAEPGAGERPVVFLFSGQGAQYPGMGRGLYAEEPAFRSAVDQCAEILRPLLGLDLRELLFLPDGTDPAEAAARLEETRYAQPALFTVEYALAQLWEEWGVRPAAMLGHSIGEYVAACLAGVFSLEDALALVAERGRLMQEAAPAGAGAMLAVQISERELEALLPAGLSIAAVNGPADCVASGPAAVVAELERPLAAREIRHRRLHTSHAFHSAQMEPAVAPFVERVRRVELRAPQVPCVSNLTGDWMTAEQATDPAYWGAHLRGAVRFGDGIARLFEEPGHLGLEVGPGRALATLARQTVPGRTIATSIPHPRDGRAEGEHAAEALGRLWMAGAAVDWTGYHRDASRRRVPLPTYPFERKRHFITGAAEAPAASALPDPLARKADLADWFYVPVWNGGPLPPRGQDGLAGVWLVLAEPGGLGGRLADRLRGAGAEVRVVGLEGEGWAEALEGVGRVVVGEGTGVRALLGLFQTLARRPEPAELTILTESLYRVTGQESLRPEGALFAGLARALPQEEPRIACREVDVESVQPGSDDEEDLLDALLCELAEPVSAFAGTPVAFRGGRRWVRSFAPVRLEERDGPGLLRPAGVYLITGGLGGLGLELAAELARSVRARLVLTGRTAPPRAEWPARLREIEALGSEILVLQADAADPAAMAAAFEQARERFGAVHGVIHAAGLPGGGLLQGKTPEAAAAVLAPKVGGARSLEPLIAGRELDFVLLCSSINGVAGGFGQADYCAANAYLDAFAEARDRRRGPRVLSVGWDRWAGTGMARAGLPGLTEAGAVHPLLGALLVRSPGREVYRTELAAEEQWVLSEHRIAGHPTVPGTTYLEMARAAWQAGHGPSPVEIRNVIFLEPLVVRDGERREVLTLLEKGPEGTEIRVLSRRAGTEDGWQEHVRGEIGTPAAGEEPGPQADIPEIAARCDGELDGSGDAIAAKTARGFLVTGPRWACLKRVRRGPGELLSELELAPELAADLETFPLHPALLDVATGHVQLVAEGDFLPFTYERLRVLGPLPRRLWSHVRIHPDLGGAETIRCDVTLLDEEGLVRAAAEGFAMRRVSAEARAQIGTARGSATVEVPLALGMGPAGEGITPAEGVEAFRRLLRSPVAAHVVVSCRDLGAVIAEYRSYDANRIAAELERAAPPRAAHARPSLGTAYIAPGGELEATIAAVWSQVLGVDEVGAHDNFFELGGTSLAGVQVVSELKKRLGRDIPPVSIFEAPTVSALARYLTPRTDGGSAFAKARSRAAQKRQALAQSRPAMRGGRR